MVPNRKLAAYRRSLLLLSATPLYTAPIPDRSTSGFQPEMVPSSVTKMNLAGLPEESSNPVPSLNCWPVGAEGPVLPRGPGIVTTSDWATPLPSYRVATPVPLSDTQMNVFWPKDIPQALTRFGSVNMARPGTSETRFVCW